jgi:hypothetical protein
MTYNTDDNVEATVRISVGDKTVKLGMSGKYVMPLRDGTKTFDGFTGDHIVNFKSIGDIIVGDAEIKKVENEV